MRPRGWHLAEKHLQFIDRAGPTHARHPASLVDFGLYFFHNAQRADRRRARARTSTCRSSRATSRRGSGTTSSPSREERLGIPHGTIRATVLIETIHGRVRDGGDPLRAARPLRRPQRRALGLHLLHHQDLPRPRPPVRPARPQQITMTVPFMRAYTELLVATCHRRGRLRHRRHERVHPEPARPGGHRARRSSRSRPTSDARPATASTAPGSRTPTSSRPRRPSSTRCSATGRTSSTASATTCTSPRRSCSTSRRHRRRPVTDGGRARQRVDRAPLHRGVAARASARSAIDNLMEDAATAEISRSQIWQWIHQDSVTAEGTPDRRPRGSSGCSPRCSPRCPARRATGSTTPSTCSAQVALGSEFPTFLTVPAYTRTSSTRRHPTACDDGLTGTARPFGPSPGAERAGRPANTSPPPGLCRWAHQVVVR